MITQNSQNSQPKFVCEKCDYKCCRKSDYNKHLMTPKHLNNDAQLHKTLKTLKKYICPCGKEYSYRQGLYLHKQNCDIVTDYDNIDVTDSNIIVQLIKQNEDFKNLLIDQNKTIIELSKNNNSMTNCNNTTNLHNKTFNLNVFLNETCKDAMNIMDFVDSVKLQLADLEKVGEIGYIDGISNIIVKNLKALDIDKRPVHCSDTKREVLYVKDEDKWEKENEEKNKIRKAIKHIAHKNSKLLTEFKEKHPDCGKSVSRFSDKYTNLVIEAMGGKGDNDLEKEDKIIRNIAKEVTIDKNIN